MLKVKMDNLLKLGTILRETHNFRRLLKPWNILFIQLVSAFTMILGNSVDLFWKKKSYMIYCRVFWIEMHNFKWLWIQDKKV